MPYVSFFGNNVETSTALATRVQVSHVHNVDGTNPAAFALIHICRMLCAARIPGGFEHNLITNVILARSQLRHWVAFMMLSWSSLGLLQMTFLFFVTCCEPTMEAWTGNAATRHQHEYAPAKHGRSHPIFRFRMLSGSSDIRAAPAAPPSCSMLTGQRPHPMNVPSRGPASLRQPMASHIASIRHCWVNSLPPEDFAKSECLPPPFTSPKRSPRRRLQRDGFRSAWGTGRTANPANPRPITCAS